MVRRASEGALPRDGIPSWRWAILGLLLATWGAACTTFSSDPGDGLADAGAGAVADGSSVPPPHRTADPRATEP